MIDLMYLAHNRLEFTKASLAAIEQNTNWDLVDQFVIYDDNSIDGTSQFLIEWARQARSRINADIILRPGSYGHPVVIMRDFLSNHWRHSIFGKIDSDTMVPPGWLDQCFDVM